MAPMIGDAASLTSTRGVGRALIRRAAPFRRTFDSATEAAERFYAENLEFLQPILDYGEPRGAVREWLRSNAHGRTGRMRVKDLSQTPWAAKMLASPDPVKAALRNVFGHAEGRRWDRADWDAIRSLGETLAEFASESAGAGPGGWTWYPIAVEDDDAKILDRLSVEGDPDAYRRFAASLSEREVDGVVATYEREVQRLARCMPAQRRRHVESRLGEIRRWKEEGIPESVCGQGVYAGHTCDLEPLHGELQRLRDACESDAAYAAWRNEAVRRAPRAGSVAQSGEDEVPLDLVPVAAFEGDGVPVRAEACTPSEAARIMGRLGAAARRASAAKRREVREAQAAARKAERERVSQDRKAQGDANRRKAPQRDTAAAPLGATKTQPDRVAQPLGEEIRDPSTTAAVPVLEVFGADVMREVRPKHVAKAIKLLVEREGLLPSGYTLSARTPREGIVYLSARTRGKRDSAAVTAGMRRLFPQFRDGLGQSELHLVPHPWEAMDRLTTISRTYADTLRVLAQREAGVQTQEATSLDQPVPGVNPGPARSATPKKCGEQWCAEVAGEVVVGDPLQVVTRRGKRWDAVVTEVVRVYTKKGRGLSSGGRRSVVRARKLPPTVLRGQPVAAPQETSAAATRSTRPTGEALGADLRFFGRDADSKDRRLRHEEGIAVLEGKPAPDWAVYVFAYPRERRFEYVRGNGEYRVVVSGPQGLALHLKEALRRLRRDRDAETLAKDELAMLDTLTEFHKRLSGSSSASAASPSESSPPRPAPRMPARGQGSLVTVEEEGFALTPPRGTPAVHGASAGTGGTQSVLRGVSRKVSATKLAQMQERERVRRVAGRASQGNPKATTDMSGMPTAKLQALVFELEGQLGVGSWPKARVDAHHQSIGAATAELFARGVLKPVLFGEQGVSERPLTAMSADAIDNAFRGDPPDFAVPRWLATNVAYVLAPQLEGSGLTLVRGPQSKTSDRAESLYVERKGALLAYGGRRARVTVRRYGGYYTVEVEGMPERVATLAQSAAQRVLGDPVLQMRAQGSDASSWRRV